MMRINAGSGQRKFGEGWTNVDINPKWQPDVVADCSHMPMFLDNSADLIVCHHNLEHYGCGEGDAMLAECSRILAPGGSLLVFVPDAPALARAYIDGTIDDYIYAVNTMGAYMDSEADRHRWIFSAKSLTQTLHGAAKWSQVKRFDWREIPGSDLARDWWVLALEAIK